MSHRTKVIVRSICGSLAALAFLTSMITAAFFATENLYTRIGFYQPAFAVQIINTLLGLFFAFLILFDFRYSS